MLSDAPGAEAGSVASVMRCLNMRGDLRVGQGRAGEDPVSVVGDGGDSGDAVQDGWARDLVEAVSNVGDGCCHWVEGVAVGAEEGPGEIDRVGRAVFDPSCELENPRVRTCEVFLARLAQAGSDGAGDEATPGLPDEDGSNSGVWVFAELSNAMNSNRNLTLKSGGRALAGSPVTVKWKFRSFKVFG